MPQYSFFLINHMGEPFEASECSFDNDQDACAYAERLASRRDYPVEVKSGGDRIKLVPLMTWKAEDWLRQRRTSPLMTMRGVHPRALRPPNCIKCRSPTSVGVDAKLCERCGNTSGKKGDDR